MRAGPRHTPPGTCSTGGRAPRPKESGGGGLPMRAGPPCTSDRAGEAARGGDGVWGRRDGSWGILVTEPPRVRSSGAAAGLGQAGTGPRAARGGQRPTRPLLRASPARAPHRSGLRTADQASDGDTPARGSAASRPGPAAIGCGSPGPAPGAAAGVAERRCHLGRAAARGGGRRREHRPGPARRDTFSKCCCPEFASPEAGRAQPARLRRRALRGE